MRRFLNPLLNVGFLALCLSCVQAQGACPPALSTPSAQQIASAQQGAKNRGYLWRISKDGRTSYLYGTIHVAKFEWVFPGPDLMVALQSTDSIALELNPLDEPTMRRLQEAMAMANTKPLPAPLQIRIARFAKTNCIPVDALRAMRPEFQVSTLAESIGRSEGLEPVFGIDLQLALLAQQSHKRIDSLESVEEQLNALLTDDSAQTLVDTQDALAELESGLARTMLLKIARAWAGSDFQTLNSYPTWCHCVDKASEKLAMKRLLDDRNPIIAQRLDQLHNSGTRVFAAVGALHMIGPIGLPTLMAQRGYTVEKVF